MMEEEIFSKGYRKVHLESCVSHVTTGKFFCIAGLLGSLVAGCSQNGGTFDLAFETSSAQALERSERTVQSRDGRVRLTVPMDVQKTDLSIRPIEHLLTPLESQVGMAYGVSFRTRESRSLLTIQYDEEALPVGADEADLTLGRIANHQWEELPEVTVDVISNTVSATVLPDRPTDIYSLLVRPYPVFLNPSFDRDVASPGESLTGWVSGAQSPTAGGRKTIHGNNLFLIQDQGQRDSDPSLRQTVSGFIPGRVYTITGLFGRYGDCCQEDGVPSFGVAVDGQVLLEWSRPLEEGLVPFSATLQAKATSHEIALIAERNGSHAAYFVDDLAIIPERGFRLHISKEGVGKGIVRSNPTGMDCGHLCSSSFSSGGRVTLVAEAAPGSLFSGFVSKDCVNVSVCALTMDSAKTVTARFISASTNAYLARLEANLQDEDKGEQLYPNFVPGRLEYTLTRIEKQGFVTLTAISEDGGASIRIGDQGVPSGQPVPFYFNGDEGVVPIVVTAQDGQTTKEYTVRWCRWYCSPQTPERGRKETL